MTRETKFRGKDILTDKWVYGDLLHLGEHCVIVTSTKNTELEKDVLDRIIFNVEDIAVVVPETVGQFTGLLDKNGKEIYEGDIVRKKEIGGYGYEYIGVVRYYEKDCRFGIDLTATDKFSKRGLFTDGEVQENDGHCTITYTVEYEVLGNIYDKDFGYVIKNTKTNNIG